MTSLISEHLTNTLTSEYSASLDSFEISSENKNLSTKSFKWNTKNGTASGTFTLDSDHLTQISFSVPVSLNGIQATQDNASSISASILKLEPLGNWGCDANNLGPLQTCENSWTTADGTKMGILIGTTPKSAKSIISEIQEVIVATCEVRKDDKLYYLVMEGCLHPNPNNLKPTNIQTPNTPKRRNDLNTIGTAISIYISDTEKIPSGISTSIREIKKVGGIDLCSTLVPQYISSIPSDPKVNNGESIKDCSNNYSTGYTLILNQDNTITISVDPVNIGYEEKVSLTVPSI